MEIILTGSGTATCVEFTVTSTKGPIGKLARDMLASGLDPKLGVTVTRNGTVCFAPATLGAWAGVSVSETDHGSVKMVKYRAMPEGLRQSPTP